MKLEADGGEGQQQMVNSIFFTLIIIIVSIIIFFIIIIFIMMTMQVRFVSFQPHKWNQTFTLNRVKLPTPVLKVIAIFLIIIVIVIMIIMIIQVSADKGFNFSSLDDAFIAQKKNHFQLTCHVVKVVLMMIMIMSMTMVMVIETMMKEGEHQLVSTEAGFRQIEHLQLNFYGVKSEAQEQRIQVITSSQAPSYASIGLAKK